jgi:hypothetical protein
MSLDDEDPPQEEKMPLWQSRPTCWMSSDRQGTPDWGRKRIGCITASIISKVCGRDGFRRESPEEVAEIICGLSEKSFKPDQKILMQDGIRKEPSVRKWFSQEIIHYPIKEVGIAVWKEDPYMRASLDGETLHIEEGKEPQEAAIEIKIPRKLYDRYRDVAESWTKGLNNPHPESYIFNSHYDQMTAGSVITGKAGCYYIVADISEKEEEEDQEIFHQYIETDINLWNNILYPAAKAFRQKYVVPLLKKHGISVIMPPVDEEDE